MSAARYRSYIGLFVAQLCIAAATILGRFALQGASPVVASALRMGFAALPLVVWAVIQRERRLPWRVEGLLGAAGAVLAGHFIIWLASLQYASVAVSTLLVSSSPLWNSLYDILVLRRMPPLTFIAGLVASLAGLGLVVQGHATAVIPPIPGHPEWGAALALVGALFMSVYLLLVEQVGNAARRGGFVCSTRSVVTRTFTWAALDLLVLIAWRHETLPAADNVASWSGLIGMAVFSQLIGHTLMNGAVRTFAASLVALAGLLVPVFAAGLAALIFQEHLTARMCVGSVLILAGLAAALQSQTDGGAVDASAAASKA